MDTSQFLAELLGYVPPPSPVEDSTSHMSVIATAVQARANEQAAEPCCIKDFGCIYVGHFSAEHCGHGCRLATKGLW